MKKLLLFSLLFLLLSSCQNNLVEEVSPEELSKTQNVEELLTIVGNREGEKQGLEIQFRDSGDPCARGCSIGPEHCLCCQSAVMFAFGFDVEPAHLTDQVYVSFSKIHRLPSGKEVDPITCNLLYEGEGNNGTGGDAWYFWNREVDMNLVQPWYLGLYGCNSSNIKTLPNEYLVQFRGPTEATGTVQVFLTGCGYPPTQFELELDHPTNWLKRVAFCKTGCD